MTSDTFQIQEFLDELLLETNLKGHSKEIEIREAMAQALHDSVFKAVSQNIEDEVIMDTLNDLQNESDPMVLIRELISRSLVSQMAIIEAIEAFKTETLNAYNQLNNHV